ncbi:MAG: fumarylacetoacetate hydrolase family protein [SAR202 cluster bacterium]|nr:fumarylacetoacetate hydrolase family protein [SAR202 cluster bacterium]
MKYARFQIGGKALYGQLEGQTLREITGAPWLPHKRTDRAHKLSDANLLSPCDPGKIIAIGLNYSDHLGDRPAPKVPEPFFKTVSCMVGPGDAIVLPREATKVQEEAEVAIVIGKQCKNATVGNALDFIFGYTCANDVSERNWQKNDLQWWRAKASDTFGPIGPYIATGLDPANIKLYGRINGEVIQEGTTANLIHSIPKIIEFISRVITLQPGDLILTGTPGIPKDIKAGDSVEVEVEGVGVLSNPVRAEQA